MRLLLSIVICVATNLCLAQEVHTYRFEIDGLTEIAQAKGLQEFAAPLFDDTPEFNDATDRFYVSSDVLITEIKFRSKLQNSGWVLKSFTRTGIAPEPK